MSIRDREPDDPDPYSTVLARARHPERLAVATVVHGSWRVAVSRAQPADTDYQAAWRKQKEWLHGIAARHPHRDCPKDGASSHFVAPPVSRAASTLRS